MQLCLACHSSKQAYPRWDSPIVGSNDHPDSSLNQQPLVWRKKRRRPRWDNVKIHSWWLYTSPRQCSSHQCYAHQCYDNTHEGSLISQTKPQKNKKHIQQLLPIVRGGKPQREGVTNSRDKIRNAQGVKYDKLYWGCKPHTTSHRRLDCVKRFRFNGSGSSSCSRSLIDCLLTSINYSLFN